jgi:hypothetical protein
VYVTVRMSRGEGLLERVRSPDELPLVHALEVRRILVPMKLGIIGEEMLATAIKLASDHGAQVEALHVIRVPLAQALDAPLAEDQDRADEALSEAKALAVDYVLRNAPCEVLIVAFPQSVMDEELAAST